MRWVPIAAVLAAIIALIVGLAFGSDLGNTGSILQGTLGFAAAIGGALVAIRIAGVGTQLIAAEKRRNDVEYLDTLLDKGFAPLTKVAQFLTKLYVITRQIENTWMRIDQKGDSNRTDSDVNEIKILMGAFSQALAALAGVVEQIEYSALAKYLWLAEGEDISKSKVSQFNFTDIAVFLAVSAETLLSWNDSYFQLFADAQNRVRVASQAEKVEFGDRAESFLRMGALTFTDWDEDGFDLSGVRLLYSLAKRLPKSYEEMAKRVQQVLSIREDGHRLGSTEELAESDGQSTFKLSVTASLLEILGKRPWVGNTLGPAIAEMRKLSDESLSRLFGEHKWPPSEEEAPDDGV